MKYLDLHLKENLIKQTSFLRKNASQKPASFRVKTIATFPEIDRFRPLRFQLEIPQTPHNLFGTCTHIDQSFGIFFEKSPHHMSIVHDLI